MWVTCGTPMVLASYFFEFSDDFTAGHSRSEVVVVGREQTEKTGNETLQPLVKIHASGFLIAELDFRTVVAGPVVMTLPGCRVTSPDNGVGDALLNFDV